MSMLKATADLMVVGATTTIVVPAVIKTGAVVALNTVGFTRRGPAAGTYAAAWMSSIAEGGGGVAAGTVYTSLQSAAMTMPLVDPVAAVVFAGAAAYYYVFRT